MKKYYLKLNKINDIKNFIKRISSIESDGFIRTEDRKYCVDAKSIMGIFSLDLTKTLILEINNEEEQFIKDIEDMGIAIKPISLGD